MSILIRHPLIKKEVNFYVALILTEGKLGNPIEVFLTNNGIRKSEWDCFAKKHKKIRVAMNDAKHFAKGKVLEEIRDLMHDRKLNTTVAKMYIENMTGWGMSGEMENAAPATVIINTGKPSPKEEE